jgi:vacuolar-type H+-ATPase subunit H
MTDRILLDIAGAEAQAAEMERQAAQTARDMVADARMDVRRLLEQATTDAELRMKERIAQRDQALAQAGQERLEQAQTRLEGFRRLAAERMEAAAASIVEGVVNAYGHR